jgi:hypothetical protein
MYNAGRTLIISFWIATSCQFFPQRVCFAQGATHSVTVSIPPSDTLIQLPHQFIIQNSENVLWKSDTLKRGNDYTFNYTEGKIRFYKVGTFFSSHTDSLYILKISYQYFPFNIPTEYTHNVVVVKYDTTLRKSVSLIEKSTPITPSEFFGSNIQKSGSIVRGFTIGSNQDFTLNSGFRMQLSGNLTNDINVTAALTDESSPIQPEGTTKTLQEFDKVFITIKSPHIMGTLGDFELSQKGTEFGVINRKLQGAMGNATYGRTSVMLSGAVSRGKFITQQILPVDGNLGPYQLVGADGSPNIIVIAGTEKVYLDGVRMVRGESNDYTIDYSNAQITFTAKHLITDLSRIYVDFEYSDGNYSRTFAGGDVQTSIPNNKIEIGVSYYREGDDPNSLFGASLSDSDRSLLIHAGRDRLAASKTGVQFVGRDSISGIGKGQYRLDSVVISGKTHYIYRYVQPTDTANLRNAVYSVSFSEVGQGKGDYQSVGFGQFNFVGIGQGDYLPIVILPMPQSQQLADISASYHFSKDGTVTAEYAASSFDLNTLSSLPGTTLNGYGTTFSINFAPKHLIIGNSDIGSLTFNEITRYEDSNFHPMDRTNDVEFNREWAIDTSLSGNELLNQIHLDFSPHLTGNKLAIGGDAGKLTRGAYFSSERYSGFATLSADSPQTSNATLTSSLGPTFSYRINAVNSEDKALANSTAFFSQSGTIQYRAGRFVPGIRFTSEDRRTATVGTDSIWENSYRFVEYGPTLAITQLSGFDISLDGYVHDESGVIGGELLPSSRSLIGNFTSRYNAANNFFSNLTLTYRKKRYAENFLSLNNSNSESLLSKWEAYFTPLNHGIETNLFYQVVTERAARLQQIFWKVLPGQGQYIWTDSKHNGQVDITDPTEFQQVNFNGDYILLTRPTTTLYPVVNLKTNLRLNLTPQKFLKSKNLVSAILRSLSTSTILQIAESNQTTNVSDIYLLHLSKFLNDTLTLNGSQLFQQDIYVLQDNRDFSLRLRFLQNKSLSQYSTSTERGYKREQSARLRAKLSDIFYEELDASLNVDNVITSYAQRAHEIDASALASTLSYRPDNTVQSSFKIQLSKAADAYRNGMTNFMNTEVLNVTYSILTKGRLSTQIERDEVSIQSNLTESNIYLPFELTQGFAPGQTYTWQIGFEYRINSFVQASASYTGRQQPHEPTINTMTAEVRAFF